MSELSTRVRLRREELGLSQEHFYAGSCRLPGIQSPTRTRSGINSGRRFYF